MTLWGQKVGENVLVQQTLNPFGILQCYLWAQLDQPIIIRNLYEEICFSSFISMYRCFYLGEFVAGCAPLFCRKSVGAAVDDVLFFCSTGNWSSDHAYSTEDGSFYGVCGTGLFVICCLAHFDGKTENGNCAYPGLSHCLHWWKHSTVFTWQKQSDKWCIVRHLRRLGRGGCDICVKENLKV